MAEERHLTAEEYYDILSLDFEYRKQTRSYECSNCGAKWTPKHIRDTECPKCGANDIIVPSAEVVEWTKTSRIQLPVMDNRGDDRETEHYRLLYSNTDNAWSQKKTRDWVVVYAWFRDEDYEIRHIYTVLTDGNGVRVIVGQPDPREEAEEEEPHKEDVAEAAPPPRPAIDLDEEITGDLEVSEKHDAPEPKEETNEERLRKALANTDFWS